MVTRALDVLVLGPPGAGKGTQSQRLAATFDLLHLSTGDLLREEVARGTALGQEAGAYMQRGELVPDELVASMLLRKLHSQRGAAGCVYDGYPRTLHQAELLDGLLAELNRRVDVAVNLRVPDEEIVQRNAGRRACAACGAVFHVDLHSPRQAGVCDACGGPLTQREDDSEEVIRERLRVDRDTAGEVLAMYSGRGILREVSGLGTPEEVQERMRTAMGSRRK